jgi:hypothetical protein
MRPQGGVLAIKQLFIRPASYQPTMLVVTFFVSVVDFFFFSWDQVLVCDVEKAWERECERG